MDKSEIKPCPFCGAKLLGSDQRNVFAHPISTGCFLDGRYVSDIKAWNTRVPKKEEQDDKWDLYKQGYEDGKYKTAMEIKKWLLDMCDAPHWCVWMSDIEHFFEGMYENREETTK